MDLRWPDLLRRRYLIPLLLRVASEEQTFGEVLWDLPRGRGPRHGSGQGPGQEPRPTKTAAQAWRLIKPKPADRSERQDVIPLASLLLRAFARMAPYPEHPIPRKGIQRLADDTPTNVP